MKIKITHSNLLTFALALVPFCIFFAIDGTFSVQSILIVVFILLFSSLYFFNFKIYLNRSMKKIFLLYCISIIGGLLFNLLFEMENIKYIYFIRIIYFLVIMFFYCYCTNYKLTKKNMDFIFKANIIVGVIISLYFILVEPIWYKNLIGVTIDKNFSAGILSIQIQFALIRMFECKKIHNKIYYALSYAIILIGIFISASRASMLVCVGASGLIVFDELSSTKRTKIILKRALIFLFILIVIGIFLPDVTEYILSHEKLEWYWNRYFVKSYNDTSNNNRIAYWLKAIDLWLNRPLFGYGSGMVYTTGNISATSHNTFIDTLVDNGILGFIAIVNIFIRSIKGVMFGERKKYRAIAISVFLQSIILSATRSVLMWYTLIILWHLGNMTDNYNYKDKSLKV